MALERVYDARTNSFETIDFVPVNSWNSTDRIVDPMFDRMDEFRDHTRPSFQTSEHRNELAKSIDSISLPRHAEHKLRLSNWRKPVYDAVKRHGDFAPSMIRAFTNILDRKNFHTALSMIQDADARLRADGVRRSRNDEEIVELAKAKARAFSKQLLIIDDIQERFEKAESLIAQLGLSFNPDQVKKLKKSGELESLCNRVGCDIWLRRQLRRQYFSEVETVARDLLLVHKTQDAYCSKHSVGVMRERKSDSEQALINTVCYIDDDPDTWFTLQELAAKSTSNPMIRRAEMFVRLRAFEEIAQDSDHVAMFFTLTTPSRFHVYKGDEINPAWVKAGRPDSMAAHKQLMGVMDAFRKELNKNEVKLYGLRIVEPHHDGTPHIHCLFFMPKEHKSYVERTFRHFAMVDSPKEKGAKKYRFKSETIDWKKGSAVGYVAKYLSKNIDGANIDTDRGTELSGSDASASVVSFNRIQGIRQFQFYGGPSVTVWREMRRFREEFKEDDAMILGNQLSEDEHFTLETIRKAADVGDFKAFIMAMGGVLARRDEQGVRAAYTKKVNIEGLFKKTRYGDEMGAAIHGIMFAGKVLPTRFKNWKFANKKQFVRGMRQVLEGTTRIFESMEDELEYYSMKQEEFERLQDEIAFYLDAPSIEASVMYGDEIYSQSEPPPEGCPSWAQPDWDSFPEALDLCH